MVVHTYHESTSGWELLHGPIMDRWRETGGSRGVLGKPTSAVRVDEVGGRTQSFENGIIYRKDLNSPAFQSKLAYTKNAERI